MKQKNFRLGDRLADQIEKDREDKNLSLNDYGIKALQHFISCSKGSGDQQGLRLILAKYPDTCAKAQCNNKIEVGDHCLWGRGMGVICMDCYVTRIGDKALVAKYLKMREYKQTIKALHKEADRLAEKVEDHQFYIVLDDMHKAAKESTAAVMKYLTSGLASKKEKEVLDKVILSNDMTLEVLEHIKRLIEKLKLRKTKKKKKKVIQ